MSYQVYRQFDANGNLLYVGASCSVATRHVMHKQNSPWFDQVRTVTFEPCASKEDAHRRERLAIENEKPLHNVQFNGEHKPIRRKVDGRIAPINFITTTQAAKAWRVSEQRVRQWLVMNRIKGAGRHGRDWLIPANAKRPAKLRNGAKA